METIYKIPIGFTVENYKRIDDINKSDNPNQLLRELFNFDRQVIEYKFDNKKQSNGQIPLRYLDLIFDGAMPYSIGEMIKFVDNSPFEVGVLVGYAHYEYEIVN